MRPGQTCGWRGGGANVTRQAEMGMIQPCSKDGGTGGERQEHEGGREGGYRQHMEQEKKN